jgi:hypothetical protein
MKKHEFIDTHVEHLMEKDADVRRYFERAKTDQEKELLRKGLEQSLETAYNSYAKDYFESGGTGKTVSKLLRYAALGADLIGSYSLLFSLAGFGFKGVGALAKAAAEYLDNKHYEKHKNLEGIVTKDGLKIATEAAGQIGSAYIIPGSEIWAFLRGTKKYDEKIAGQALYRAKTEFIKRFGEVLPEKKELKLVPLEEFVDQRYGKLAFNPA